MWIDEENWVEWSAASKWITLKWLGAVWKCDRP